MEIRGAESIAGEGSLEVEGGSEERQPHAALCSREHSQQVKESDFTLYSALVNCIWNRASSFGFPVPKQTLTNWQKFSGGAG